MPNRAPDFEAKVRFLTREEGGRSSPARQGRYRPDIHVDDDPSEQLWMIWPRFLDESGGGMPEGGVAPQISPAHFYIANPAVGRTGHPHGLREGERAFLCERAPR